MRTYGAAVLLGLSLFAVSGSAALFIEAENYDEKSGEVAPETKSNGVVCLGFIKTGNWVKYNAVDFGFAMTHFNARVASKTDASFGSIGVYVDSLDGTRIAVLTDAPVAGGWSDFGTVSVPLAETISGVHDLHLELGYGYNVDWIMFNTTIDPTLAPTSAPPTEAPAPSPPTPSPPTQSPPTVEAFPNCTFEPAIVDGWIQAPEDVRSYLQYLRGPSKPSEFLEANDASRAHHKALFAALDQEDYAAVQQAAQAANYAVVCRLHQTRAGKTDTILLFSGEYDAPDQQIHLLWRTGVTDPLIIESGHTHTDQAGGGNAEVATNCFVLSNARMLLRDSIAATKAAEESPCSGDYTISNGPHYDKGWFHMAHLEYFALYPTDAVIQFHGMKSQKADGSVVYIHISPGFKDVAKADSLIRYFDNGLAAAFDKEYVDEFMASSARPSPWTVLRTFDYHPATFNVQGRHVNNSPDPCKTTATASQYNSAIQQFVHLELSSNPRQNHVGELGNAVNYAGAHWKARLGEILLVEAESYDAKNGTVQSETKANGVVCLGFIDPGNWVKYSNLDFGEGRATFKAHVSTRTGTSAGTITVHIDSIESTPVAELNAPVGGGWSNFGLTLAHLSETVSGVHDVYLKFDSGYNLDWFTFDK